MEVVGIGYWEDCWSLVSDRGASLGIVSSVFSIIRKVCSNMVRYGISS